jgi:hypothetical protein
MSEPRKILVVANETVTGQPLIDAVKRRAEGSPVSVHVICPQNQPKHGYVIYDDTIRGAAENRLAMTLAQLREVGVEATGDVEDPDPYSAIMDAVGERDYDEIVISTHPDTRSGWLRQDLITRVEQATRRPVEHIVVDLGPHDPDEGTRTLVVANQTVGGQPLIDRLKQLAAQGPHRFIVVCPQGGAGENDAHRRLAHTLKRLQDEGLDAIGQVTHPDPYTAIQQALHFYGVDEVVISTFPATRSGWLRSDLLRRVQASTDKPVHHVVVPTEQVEQAEV